MLDTLRIYLPSPDPSLPVPGVSIVSAEEKTVGVGNRVGTGVQNSFLVSVLKGGRLKAVVRFQLWATDLGAVDIEMDALHGRLLSAQRELQSKMFLKLSAAATSLAEFVAPLNIWRKTTNYDVLYEFTYEDAGGAESLITKIPVAINSEYGEATVVTGRLVRWDNISASVLQVRGIFTFKRLSALTFVSSVMPTGSVRFLRTFDGAVGAPTNYPMLALFLAAVTGDNPSDRHAEFTFSTFSDLIAALSVTGDPVILGDWDEDMVSDSYNSQQLILTAPLRLPSETDYLEIQYQNAALDQVAVLYLRALPT